MTNPEIGIAMMGLFIVVIFLGFPIAFTLLALGFTFGYALKGDIIFTQVVIKAFEVTTNDVLTAVPLFLFMGYIVERANILDRLFHSIQSAARVIPGSLAVATLVTCALFATATGIVGAVVTLMGLLAFPVMLQKGYDRRLAAGVVCAGGTLGIMIPPSILLILYAAISGISAVRLYAGAFFPGMMLAFFYVAYVVVRVVINPRLAPKAAEGELEPLGITRGSALLAPMLIGGGLFVAAVIALWAADLSFGYVPFAAAASLVVIAGLSLPSLRRTADAAYPILIGLGLFALIALLLWLLGTSSIYLSYVGAGCAFLTLMFMLLGWEVTRALLKSFFPLAFLISAVLGAVLFGWATPSEAAGVGSLGALLLAAAYRALSFQRLREAVYLTARTTAMVCWLFVGSWTFSSVFSDYGGHEVVEHFVKSLDMQPWQFLVLTQLIIFLLGWPLEWSEIIIIFVPIFLPLLKAFGVDPMLFGILVALNIQTSFNTPPMAMACYYLKGVAGRSVELTEIFAGALPFVFLVFVAMAILYVFPEVATWLPSVLYDR
jgi:TRAP-type mannitol/chloroaromatic compound transport system permease large subunit